MSATPGQYNTNINGLRGLCVALVFVFHVLRSGLPAQAAPDSGWQQALSFGASSLGHGVEVFFMISGYVIVLSLRRHASVAGFLIDRCLRIFPLWIPVLLAICVLGPWLGWRPLQQLDFSSWLVIVLANLALLAPFLPVQAVHPGSWSLTCEWMFYLSAAGVVALSRAPRLPHKLCWPAAMIVGSLAVWVFPASLFFLSGVAVATGTIAAPSGRPLRWLGGPALLLFLLLWRSVSADEAGSASTLGGLLFRGHGPAILGAFIAGTFFFACCVHAAPTSMRLLRSRALQSLGTISYSFYLCHLLVMFAVKRVVLLLMPGAVGSWAAVLVFALVSAGLSAALAWLCWRWLEQGLGEWLRRRRFTRSGVASAASPAGAGAQHH